MDKPKARTSLAISRSLLLGWCLWLLLSWLLNLSLFPARRTWLVYGDLLAWRIPAEAFVPMVRGMLISTMAGMMLVWPAWRLSYGDASEGGRPVRIGRQTAIDFTAMWLIAQVVVWPMRALSDLSPQRLAVISLVLGVWGAAATVVVWLGRRSASPAWRAVAMGVCAMLFFGGWIVAFAAARAAPAEWSPLHMLWVLADASPRSSAERLVLLRLAVVGGVVLCAWLVGLIGLRIAGRR